MSRERPVFLPEFAAYVERLRKARQPKPWNQNEAAAQAARRPATAALTRQVLLRLERGQIKNPEPAVLRAIGVLYGVPYREVVERLVQEQFETSVRPDLIRHSGDQQSGLPSQEGDALDPAAARLELQELRALVGRYEKEAREMRSATDAIVKVAIALEQIRKTPKGKFNGRGGDRKVG